MAKARPAGSGERLARFLAGRRKTRCSLCLTDGAAVLHDALDRIAERRGAYPGINQRALADFVNEETKRAYGLNTFISHASSHLTAARRATWESISARR